MSSKRSLVGDDEDDDEERQNTFFAYFAMQTAVGSLPKNQLRAVLNSNQPQPPRARRVHKIPRPDGGSWTQMEEVWPTLPGNMCNEKYYEYFRMDKPAFNHVFGLVEGEITYILAPHSLPHPLFTPLLEV